MANDFYNHGSYPATGSQGASASMRAELDSIAAGFDKLAPLTGNGGKFLIVNSGGTAQSVSSALSESGGNISITGTTTLASCAVTGVLAIAVGSAAAPGVSFTGDANTGLFSAGADAIGVATAGVQRALFTTVGMTITSAAASDASLSLQAISYARDWRLKVLNSDGSFRLRDETGAGDRLVINVSGDVGVSMTPVYKLDVTGGAGNGVRYTGPTAQTLLGETSGLGAVGTLTNHALQILINSAAVARFSTGGHFGLGVTPNAGWRAGAAAIQAGGYLAAWTQANGSVNLGFGLYEGGTNTFNYLTTGDAPTLYSQLSGNHIWFRASAGVTGGAVTLTENGRFDESGRLRLNGAAGFGGVPLSVKVGTNQQLGVLTATLGGTAMTTLAALTDAGVSTNLLLAGSDVRISGDGGSTQHMRIETSGRVLVGASTAGISNNGNTMLTLRGGTGAYLSASAPTGQELIAGADSSGVVLGAFSNSQLAFRTNNTDRATITAGGLFLINRTTDSGFGVLQVSSGGSQVADFTGTTAAYINVRVGAGAIAGVRIGGNATTPGSSSFDLQQDSSSNVDIVNRSNTRLSLYTNNAEVLRLTAAGLIQDAAGNELGFKGLPTASVASGAFVAADRGKRIKATAGVTIPNSVMSDGDVVHVLNTTGSAITITRSITTAYNKNTGATLGATFTLAARGSMTIEFTSGTECYVGGNIS